MAKLGEVIDKSEYEAYVTLGGGRISCLRCTAKALRTGEQCGKPAMRTSQTQKCTHHGGRSTGPKTASGRRRIAQAHTIHGESSKVARTAHSKASAELSRLEDALHVLGMTSAPRTRGRKPAGYRPVMTLADIQRLVRLHHV